MAPSNDKALSPWMGDPGLLPLGEKEEGKEDDNNNSVKEENPAKKKAHFQLTELGRKLYGFENWE